MSLKIHIALFMVSGCLSLQARQYAEDAEFVAHRKLYQETYEYLAAMLEGDTTLSFKNAVYAVENAYLNNRLDYDTFDLAVRYYADLALQFSKRSNLMYEGEDRSAMNIHGSIFTIMTADEPIFLDSSYYFKPNPFVYDFDDFWGEQDWTKMFISKLLYTHSGNCHSLPYLYKMLADELHVKAYLAFAPNHTYIKIHSQNPRIGWYNTELTNATFPIDAWIKSSGYVHLDAIRNGVYMDTVCATQEIATCLIDLAKGYERLFNDTAFLMTCTDLALRHYPNYINALLLKAETMKKQVEAKMSEQRVAHASQTFNDPTSRELFQNMEKLYFHIFTQGYRTMPKEMYINWLTDLKEHRDKYMNKNLIQNIKTTSK